MRQLVVALGVLAVLAVAAGWGAGRFLVVADPLPEHADAIVVMAGSVADRALEAAELYAHGLAPTIVLTRERLPPELVVLRRRGSDLPEGDALSAQVLTDLGVPERAILRLPKRADSTAAEARNIADLVCRDDLGSLIVVTSPWHTRRTRLILERTLPAGVQLTVRPAPASGFSAARWWSERWAAKHVLTEYQKLAHYWLRERWTLTPACRRRSAAERRPAAQATSTAPRIIPASSPLACSSRMMSQPPTNFPATKTCGMVGQLV